MDPKSADTQHKCAQDELTGLTGQRKVVVLDVGHKGMQRELKELRQKVSRC